MGALVKKICGILLLIFGVLAVVLCLNSMWTSMDTPLGVGDAIGSIIIVFVICGLPGCLMLYFSYRLLKNTAIQMVQTARIRREKKKQSKAERRESTRKIKKKDIQKRFVVRHMTGLELPENVLCSISLFDGALRIWSESKTYTLQLDKLRGLDYTSDIDVQQYIKSSTARGILGAATFGVAGAVIGSAPKTTNKVTIKGTVILQYTSADDVKFMIFQDSSSDSRDAHGIYAMLRPLMPVPTVQEECIDL